MRGSRIFSKPFISTPVQMNRLMGVFAVNHVTLGIKERSHSLSLLKSELPLWSQPFGQRPALPFPSFRIFVVVEIEIFFFPSP